ncbi:MAG: hypothetical protein OXF48_04715 [Bacteroidetes bacterium]|nr:hypothetical protein [Bacteroidota bacterium]
MDNTGFSENLISRELDEATAQELNVLIESDTPAAINLLKDLHPADVARFVTELGRDDAASLTLSLPTIVGANVLAELDESFCADLLSKVSTERITALLNELESDDAADVLGNLDEKVRQRVLRALEDREAVRDLLEYGEETAGGIMATEVVAVLTDWTVAEATEEIRRNAENTQDVDVAFDTDKSARRTG